MYMISCQRMSCYISTEPSGPPQNVMVMEVRPSSLRISWQPPPAIDQNGPITGYRIQYIMVSSNTTMDENVTNRTTFTISNLFPFANYSIRVAAMTVNGTGVYSSPIIETSGHEGKLISDFVSMSLPMKLACKNGSMQQWVWHKLIVRIIKCMKM